MISQNEIDALNSLVKLTETYQEQGHVTMCNFFDDLFSAFSFKFTKEIFPTEIESSYTGIHLNQTYEQADFVLLIESFRNKKMIHAKYALQIIKDASSILETFSNIQECDLNKSNRPVIIVGDLHGSFKDLYYIISQFGIPGRKYNFVFNGDFVDRGPQQCEVLFTILYAFLLYPNRVFLNRGNHEDFSLNMSSYFSPNFKTDTQLKFNKYALTVFNQIQNLFTRLPLATVVANKSGLKYFIVHGGISTRFDFAYVASSRLNRFRVFIVNETSLLDSETNKMLQQMSDMLWSDPSSTPGCRKNTQRGVGFFFGPDVSESFCKKNQMHCIIRSHEVCTEGVRQDHKHCFTVFSCSRYSGGNNKAAVIKIDLNSSEIECINFNIQNLNPDENDAEKRYLLNIFKAYLNQEANELIYKFKYYDSLNAGSIRIENWAQILADHIFYKNGIRIEHKHFITLKDYLCPCNEKTYTAEYLAMFGKKTSSESFSQILESLKILFSLIDTNGDGSISLDEAKEAVNLMKRSLGKNYDLSFLRSMDVNGDGKIDINEFIHSFAKAFKLY